MTATGRGARATSRRDPEIEAAVEGAFAQGRVRTGELIELVPHGAASRARAARGISGRQVESAHGAPRAAMRNVPTYDPNAALTRLLPRQVHRNMDRSWQREARRLVREGRRTWTAREMFEAVAGSIWRTPDLSVREKISHIARLSDEVFVEWGLKATDPVRLPFS